MRLRLTDADLAVHPLRAFNGYPRACKDGWGDISDAKRHFFRRGDVVVIETQYGPRYALIVLCSINKSDSSGDWIPCYKVRLYRKDGSAGLRARWAFPAHIKRGFSALRRWRSTSLEPARPYDLSTTTTPKGPNHE